VIVVPPLHESTGRLYDSPRISQATAQARFKASDAEGQEVPRNDATLRPHMRLQDTTRRRLVQLHRAAADTLSGWARQSGDTGSVRHAAVSLMLAVAGFGGGLETAQASGIPFAGNRPESYEFPLDYKESYDSFGQFLQFNADNKSFDSNGKSVAGPGTETFVGLSARLHYWKFDSLPKVGWVASATVPEVRVQGPGLSANGIGDPLVGGLAFIKPLPNNTLGLQTLVQVPIGTDKVTTNTWSFWPSVFYDQWFANRVNLDVIAGGILRATTHRTGAHDLDQGTTLHANVRLGFGIEPVVWQKSYYPVPFVSFDYQKTGATRDDVTRLDLPASKSNEKAVGGGILFQLQKKNFYDQFEIHYSKGIAGQNTVLTNGVFMQYWHYWR
jgi:hypothetical protein